MIKLFLPLKTKFLLLLSKAFNRAKHTNTWCLAQLLKVISHYIDIKPKDGFQLHLKTNKIITLPCSNLRYNPNYILFSYFF